MNGIVYLLTCLPTGEKYVGITTVSLSRRIAQHTYDAIRRRYKRKLQRRILKYGIENFSLSILEVCSHRETLIESERRHIAELGTFRNGLNATIGGDGGSLTGRKFSAVHKAKLREAALSRGLGKLRAPEWEERRIGNLPRGENHHRYGLKFQPEWLNKALAKTQKKVVIGTEIHQSMTAAAHAIGMSIPGLRRRIESRNFPTYQWG